MKKWFKWWFLPVILVMSIVSTILLTEVPPKFTSFKPVPGPEQDVYRDSDGNIIAKRSDNVVILYYEVKDKIRYAAEQPINTNAIVGAVVGWIICKILDSGVFIIKKRIKKD